MTVPRNFPQWFDREIRRAAETVLALAKSLHEDLGWTVKRFESEGENALPATSGSGVVSRAGELAAALEALRVLKDLREQKRGFDAVEAEGEAQLRRGSAFGGEPPAPDPPSGAPKRRAKRKPGTRP